MAFALNSDTVKTWLCRHLSAHKVSRVSHGLTTKEKVAGETGSDRLKVVVEEIDREGPGHTIRKGDVIVKVGSVSVQNAFDLERAVWGHKPGDRVSVNVLREGKLLPVTMKLNAPTGTQTVAARD